MERGSNNLMDERSDVMVVMNRKGEIVYVTDSVGVILGYDKRELIGTSGFDLLFFYRAKARLQYESVLQQPNLNVRIRVWIRHKFCRPVRMEATLKNLLDIPECGGVLVLLKRITRRSNTL